jgi:hypothetical protein
LFQKKGKKKAKKEQKKKKKRVIMKLSTFKKIVKIIANLVLVLHWH